MANRWLVLRNRARADELSDLDRLFRRMLSEPFFGRNGWLSELSWNGWAPSLDVNESEDAITVRVEVPGVDPKEIDVSVSDDVLIISGEKREESEERGDGFYHAERRFGSFRRSVALPAAIDSERVSAEYDKGVLTIRLEKSEKDVPKRIPVSVSKK